MQSGAPVRERLLDLPEQIDRSSIAARAREDDEGRGRHIACSIHRRIEAFYNSSRMTCSSYVAMWTPVGVSRSPN